MSKTVLIAGGGPAALDAASVGTLVMEYHLLGSLRARVSARERAGQD